MTQQSTITTSKKVTITLPSINVKEIKNRFQLLFSDLYNTTSSNFSSASQQATTRARRFRFPHMKNNNFNFDKKYFKIIVPVIIGIIVIAAIASFIRSLPDARSSQINTSASQLPNPGILDSISLNKSFKFPLKDSKGKEVGNFDYVIQSADIQRQIIVQGQRATAVSGRLFLILNLKITNNLKQTIQLNTRDYLRLTVTSTSNEQLAPDIHNDPVEVQAISTKYTRVGVALDESDLKKTVKLRVGEIDGTKQTIDLNFKF